MKYLILYITIGLNTLVLASESADILNSVAAQECLSIEKLVKSIPKEIPFILQVKKAEVFTNHKIGNLAARHRNAFFEDSPNVFNGSSELSMIGRRFTTGDLISTEFLEFMKIYLELEKIAEDGPPAYSVTNKTETNSSAAKEISWLLFKYGLTRVFGYFTHGGLGIRQTGCENIEIPDRAVSYKIVNIVENGFDYMNKESGEFFEFRFAGTPAQGEISIHRYSYFSLVHECAPHTLSKYEIHPVKITYSMKFGDQVADTTQTTSSLPITIANQDTLASANSSSQDICQQDGPTEKVVIERSFEENKPQLSNYLRLPSVDFVMEFQYGSSQQNSHVAKEGLKEILGPSFFHTRADETFLKGLERLQIELISSTDPQELDMALEIMELGGLSADTVSEFCVKFGKMPVLPKEFIEEYPDASCVGQYSVNDYNTYPDFMTTEVPIVYDKIVPVVYLRGLPRLTYRDLYRLVSKSLEKGSPDIASGTSGVFNLHIQPLKNR